MRRLQNLIKEEFDMYWDGSKITQTQFYNLFCSVVNFASKSGWNLSWDIPRYLFYIGLNEEKPNITNDWFSHNISTWADYLDKKKPYRVLEIGCFEGLATLFLNTYYDIERYTVVDTFEGGEEHKDKDYLNKLRDRFEQNLSKYKDKLEINQMYSSTYLSNHEDDKTYNLIYIDGSHDSEDVYLDGITAFNYLEKDGIMIFDDYKWFFKGKEERRPAVGVNKFMKECWGQFEILHVDYQVILRKY